MLICCLTWHERCLNFRGISLRASSPGRPGTFATHPNETRLRRDKDESAAPLALSRAAFVLSRVGFGFFIFVTAFYCLLFYIPFSRQTLFGWNVVPVLSLFAKYHALIFFLVALPVCLTLFPYLKERDLRRPAIGFMAAMISLGALLSFQPLLTGLPPDERSFIWSLISTFPLWWIAALDWRSKSARQSPSSECVARLRFTDAVMIALCVSSVYFGIFAVRYVLSGEPTFSRSQLIFFAVCGFASHLLLFGLVFSTFKVAEGSRKEYRNREGLPLSFVAP